jgi:hypothetical protein
MVSAADIRAGRAAVEIGVDDRTDAGIQSVQRRFKRLAAEVRTIGRDWGDLGAAGKGQTAESILARPDRAAMRQQMAERTAARKAERDLAAANARTIEELDDRLFARKASRRQVELRQIERYYARLRAMHQGNAAVLAKIDAAAAVERMAVMRGPGLRGLMGEGSVVRQAGSYLASRAAFSVSPELGMAASMLRPEAAGLGALALPLAPLAALAAGLKACTDAVKDAEQAFARLGGYQDATRQAVQSSQGRRLGADPLADDRRAIEQLQAAVNEATNRKVGGQRAWEFIPIYGSIRYAASGREIDAQERAQKDADIAARNAELEAARAAMERRRAALEATAAASQQYDAEVARIAAMEDGPDKLRAELKARQELARAEAEQANAARPGSVRMDRLAAKQASEALALERQIARQGAAQRRADEARAIEASITATSDGYAREVQLLAVRHQRELADRRRAGGDVTALMSAQAAEREALERQHQDRLRDLWASAAEARANATLRGSAAQRRAMEIRQQRELEQVTDPAERQAVESRQAQERAAFERDQADKVQQVMDQAAAARIESIRNENERRRKLLEQRQAEERRAAQGETEEYKKALAERQQAERAALENQIRWADQDWAQSITDQVDAIKLQLSGSRGLNLQRRQLELERRQALRDARQAGRDTAPLDQLYDAKLALLLQQAQTVLGGFGGDRLPGMVGGVDDQMVNNTAALLAEVKALRTDVRTGSARFAG